MLFNIVKIVINCYNIYMQETKFNWPLVGNSHIIEYLEKIIINKQAKGVYIFDGPDNLGKATVARFFAQSLLCENRQGTASPCQQCNSCKSFKIKNNSPEDETFEETGSTHSDYHIIKKEKDKKNISIEQVREFIRTLCMSSFLNSYKIGIIKHAESLSQEAANALLKTLEEPRDKVIVILVVSNLEQLPDTIVSRSQVLRFYPVNREVIFDYLIEEYRASRSEAKNLSRLCLGRPALAVKFLENKDFYKVYKEKVDLFLNFFQQDINQKLKV